ncbi:hypothetical protein [Variovorax sp. J31P207]|uniref:hypothetical protein n=1 Tax=Variovorax sp. J31P207 TaxID=3053510 RepID=UPI0025766C19|nr:hypothetical protein [Variovorax sp. J31P207]MDM0069644.1 hypothetical protein [Variovorax sp. J31P207]
MYLQTMVCRNRETAGRYIGRQQSRTQQMSSHAWVETLYIAHGHPDRRVYAIPYPMSLNQKPGDMLPKDQQDWREVARLSSDSHLVYIEPEYADLAGNIVGKAGGTHFHVARNATEACVA